MTFRMEGVRETGADLEFDCATGRIAEPMTFSADGTFDVDGTFTPGMGGPVREDDPPIPEAARYMGVLRGDRIALSAILVEDGTTIGPYQLHRGEEAAPAEVFVARWRRVARAKRMHGLLLPALRKAKPVLRGPAARPTAAGRHALS